MKWEDAEKLSNSAFRRLTGVQLKTFHAMVGVIKAAQLKLHERGGRPNTIIAENRALMALEYWREYRTYFHIGQNYGLSESNTFKNIRWVEDVLIKSDLFRLPNRHELTQQQTAHKTLVIDVSESPIERPKKNKNYTTPARKRSTPLSRK